MKNFDAGIFLITIGLCTTTLNFVITMIVLSTFAFLKTTAETFIGTTASANGAVAPANTIVTFAIATAVSFVRE